MTDPRTPDAPDIPKVPDGDIPGVSDKPEITDVPEAPREPDVTDIPPGPEEPTITDLPEGPDVPEVPGSTSFMNTRNRTRQPFWPFHQRRSRRMDPPAPHRRNSRHLAPTR